jgi:hypothetical protein
MAKYLEINIFFVFNTCNLSWLLSLSDIWESGCDVWCKKKSVARNGLFTSLGLMDDNFCPVFFRHNF